MNDASWSSEDQHIAINADSKDKAQQISVKNKDSSGKWIRGLVCYILARNLSTFCPCYKASCNTQIRGSSLINLVEEIPVLSNILTITWVPWLLLSWFIVQMKGKKQSRNIWKPNFDPEGIICKFGAKEKHGCWKRLTLMSSQVLFIRTMRKITWR